MPECSSCGVMKEYTEFHKDSRTPSGHAKRCKVCRCSATTLAQAQLKKTRPEEYNHRRKNNTYRMKYGISLDEVNQKILCQDGKCPICNQELIKGVVDHDHVSGKVRDILCSFCNIGLGYFKENKTSLQKAIDYLAKHGDIPQTGL